MRCQGSQVRFLLNFIKQFRLVSFLIPRCWHWLDSIELLWWWNLLMILWGRLNRTRYVCLLSKVAVRVPLIAWNGLRAVESLVRHINDFGKIAFSFLFLSVSVVVWPIIHHLLMLELLLMLILKWTICTSGWCWFRSHLMNLCWRIRSVLIFWFLIIRHWLNAILVWKITRICIIASSELST